ncbi:MAG: hypothetical protein NW220_04815 [Leptolyngbyaceae cyanobacterium bins.349]|nr:hypothetical protein [Leptolyngbyaceae cyanobacterium bins.349]
MKKMIGKQTRRSEIFFTPKKKTLIVNANIQTAIAFDGNIHQMTECPTAQSANNSRFDIYPGKII